MRLKLVALLGAALVLELADAAFTAGVDDPLTLVRTETDGEVCEGAKPCRPGLLLPVWTPVYGISLPTKLFRAAVYLIVLIYLFLGVSIVADRFMAAIEVITSQEREVKIKKPNGDKVIILVRVWNETVSNLTLMALGSSAPEILLSIIEICGNNFEAGDLGPGTIVGSAAFNLFIIIAICIVSVPNGEGRRIQRNDVFFVTVIWSTFAYIWLYLILCVFSPNVVEVWEGLLTFLFFFLTVINAYIANRYMPIFNRRFLKKAPTGFRGQHHFHVTDGSIKSNKEQPILDSGNDAEAAKFLVNSEEEHFDAFLQHRRKFYEVFTKLRAEHPDMPLQEIGRLTAWQTVAEAPKSRAFRRIQATRRLIGSKLKAVGGKKSNPNSPRSVEIEPLVVAREPEAVVSFRPCHYICVEDVGTVHLTVVLDRGSIKEPCVVTCQYRTIEGTAKNDSDFVPVDSEVRFEPNETSKTIGVKIVDHDDYEEDEEFYVQLYMPKAFHPTNDLITYHASVGVAFEATVIVVDDDHGGAFTFTSEVFKLPENAGHYYLTVNRNRGARGKVTVPYKIKDGKAQRGRDFECDDGELVFEDKQTTADIRIRIVNDDEYEKSEDFYVELGQPVWHKEGHIVTDETTPDGRPILGDHTRCKVVIVEDDQLKNFLDRLIKKTNSSIMIGTDSWKSQFKEALIVGDFDEEDPDGVSDEVPSLAQKIMHYINLPWKLLFACIPPTDYANGWLCFVISIVFIGVITAVIGDVAAMFGCTIGLKDVVTAITLVAVGTSVPDTFASRLATIQDPTADAAVGNVTGSNAVNVFLGIGIAWAMAAIYHWSQGTVFRVAAGSLATSLALFLIGSILCIALLSYRRKKVGAELGGPRGLKLFSAGFFICVWLVYILINSLDAYCMLF